MSYPTDEELAEARTALIGTVDQLRRVLSDLNRYGDFLDSRKLTHQRDGSAWGEIYDGFKLLVTVLFPENTADIIEFMFETADLSVVEAAKFAADQNAPLSAYSTDEVRDDLVKYRAWMRSLEDGVLPPENIVRADTPEDSERVAYRWLKDQIELCLAALAYRNEPEIAA